METILFYLSKILFFVIQPSSLLVLAIAAGLAVATFTSRKRAGTRLAWMSLAALVVAGLSPLANVVVTPLETRFPKPSLEDMGPVRGLIILGGFEDASDQAGGLGLNEAAERVTEAARVARLLTSTRVVFSGGVGTILRDEAPQAPHVGRWLVDMGIAKSRILLEDRSRNTWENAVETRRLLGAEARGRWLLVTSAQHMPRAVGVFRKAGFDVVPWPVDRRASTMLAGFDSVADGLRRLDFATKEWIGLVAYWALGRTSALFPAP